MPGNKSRKEKAIPLTPGERSLLREQLLARTNGTPLVFPRAKGTAYTVNGFLMNLGSYVAGYHIDVLTNGAQQDFLVASVPEPETWAMLAGGLGMIGFLRRRRKAA